MPKTEYLGLIQQHLMKIPLKLQHIMEHMTEMNTQLSRASFQLAVMSNIQQKVQTKLLFGVQPVQT